MNRSSPIAFALTRIIPKPAVQICAEMTDLARWSEFGGYGILPGIERAEYELRTPEMVGSRIRVYNTDGSQHVEEILAWDVGERVVMQFQEFTPPLSRLATRFVETWTFAEQGPVTQATRSFQLFPRSPWTRPLLWGISLLFRRAVARQLGEMGQVDHTSIRKPWNR